MMGEMTLRPLRAEGAGQVRRHVEAVLMWGGVRMGPMGGAGRVAAFLMALALLMSPLLILVWIARSLLQDSIVLYVVVLAAASTGCACARRCSCVLACCTWRVSMCRDRCDVPN